jgi:hypothetical protein
MSWGRRYYHDRPARPKARSLTPGERDGIVTKMTEEIRRSPILTAFAVRVRSLRNRFYVEWRWDPDEGLEQWSAYGRVTPLAGPDQQLLLEVPYGQNNWSKVGTGSPGILIRMVAGDTKGTFHGLGCLDESLRLAAKANLARLPVALGAPNEFVYAETGKACSVQEVLYHFFGLPIHVIAQPAGWYSRHRTPRIAEFSADRTLVLVRFTATSWSGESFGGTCLYANRAGRWGAYTIRPNQSENMATAEKWLVKRNWKSWF